MNTINMTSSRVQSQSNCNGKTVKINLRYNMSDSGDQSKIDKKREYNRNAQRVFRQRRKEHLKNLEALERDRSSAQTGELERLRRENEELRQENDSLQRLYSSQSNSPCPQPSGSGSNTQFPHSGVSSPNFLDVLPSPLLASSPQPQQSHPFQPSTPETPGLCILVSHNMSQVRATLHSLFNPILEFPDPQQHLSLLAALAPSLPTQLRPTDLQLQTPHHIYIDLIPSPSLRNRLITAGASTATMFLQQTSIFASDSVEDHGQLTIWGEDILNEFSWEFSAEVLEQWGGWLLPSEWGERANFWRAQRGAPILPAWV